MVGPKVRAGKAVVSHYVRRIREARIPASTGSLYLSAWTCRTKVTGTSHRCAMSRQHTWLYPSSPSLWLLLRELPVFCTSVMPTVRKQRPFDRNSIALHSRLLGSGSVPSVLGTIAQILNGLLAGEPSSKATDRLVSPFPGTMLTHI